MKFKFSRICHLTQLHVIVIKKIYVKKTNRWIQFKFSKHSFHFAIYVQLVSLWFSFEIYWFRDFRKRIFVRKKNKNKNKNENENENEKNDEFMNENKNNFELNTIIVF